MNYVWDVLFRVAAMGAGIAMYSWLLAYDSRPGGSSAPGEGE